MCGATRTALVGIDGFSWVVIDRLGSLKHMPNLGEVLKKGIGGTALSVVPPVTASAWLSIATGLKPERTGVIDFFKRVDGWRLELVSSRDFEGRSIWDYASYEGLRVGVLNYPLLYPPYPVNGFMVSGLGSPDDYPHSWPSNVVEKLRESGALYKVYVNYHDEVYDDLDVFFKDVEDHMQGFSKAINLLLSSNLDLVVVVVQATDWVFHRLWAYIDESHPLHKRLKDEDVMHARRWFYEFLSMVDDVIGIVLNKVTGSGNVIVVSDHGFGPQHGVFNLCKWLIEHGYMVINRLALLKLKAYSRILKLLRPFYRVYKATFGERGWTVSMAKAAWRVLEDLNLKVIDFSHSKATCLNHTIPFGAIYLTNHNSEDLGEIIEELQRDLASLGLKFQHTLVNKRVHEGESSVQLPDALFLIEDGRVVILQDLDKLNEPLYRDEPYSPRHTGSHRLEGFFAAYGDNIVKKDHMITVRIYDIAPTILYTLEIPIPKNLDGKPLLNIATMRREPRYIEPSHYTRKRIAFKAKLKLN